MNVLDRLYPFSEDLKQEGVIFCFSGPASQSVLEGVGQAIRRKMELEDAGMSTVQRVFSIFVEQMQNIVHYSAERTPPDCEDDEGLRHGVVVVGRENGSFYVMCGNKVRVKQSEKILKHINHLSTLDKQQLKEYYKQARRREPGEDSRGAGLGFVEMFRRACEPLEYHITPMDDETVFFSVKAKG